MKNCLVLSVVLFALLAFGADGNSSEENPTQNCDDLCFCPCRPPGGGKADIIQPSQDCLARILCAATTMECDAQVMACQKPEPSEPAELCFCPCRIPFCSPEVLYYPSQECLQRIKCAFGQYECSAEYINGGGGK